MRSITVVMAAVLALLLAACAGDATETAAQDSPQATESATSGASPGQEEAGLLDEIMNEPELYTDGTVAVTAVVSSTIEGANAAILEAGNEEVLLVGPSDGSMDFSAGDTVLIEGQFQEFDSAQVGEIEGVVDEAAITEAFNGEYVIVANSVEMASS